MTPIQQHPSSVTPMSHHGDDNQSSKSKEESNKELENAIQNVSSLSRQATNNQRVIGQFSEQLENLNNATADFEKRFREIERKIGDNDRKITNGT